MPALAFSALTALAVASSAVTRDCACHARPLLGWESFPAALDLAVFEPVGTLVDDPFAEPTFAEYHPRRTRYESTDAPVAPRYFPYNRCTVSRCRLCGRAYLRYAEAGGYFVDERMRLLRAELLVDAPL